MFLSSYRNTIFNQPACIFSLGCFLNNYTVLYMDIQARSQGLLSLNWYLTSNHFRKKYCNKIFWLSTVNLMLDIHIITFLSKYSTQEKCWAGNMIRLSCFVLVLHFAVQCLGGLTDLHLSGVFKAIMLIKSKQSNFDFETIHTLNLKFLPLRTNSDAQTLNCI